METELLTTQFTAGYAASALLQWLKAKPWFPFASMDDSTLNRICAAAVAFFVAIGIHYTFDVQNGILTITGLTISNVAHGIWAWVQQYGIQQAVYKGLIQPKTDD